MVAIATFFFDVIIPGQKSAESLQDHWSSGYCIPIKTSNFRGIIGIVVFSIKLNFIQI